MLFRSRKAALSLQGVLGCGSVCISISSISISNNISISISSNGSSSSVLCTHVLCRGDMAAATWVLNDSSLDSSAATWRFVSSSRLMTSLATSFISSTSCARKQVGAGEQQQRLRQQQEGAAGQEAAGLTGGVDGPLVVHFPHACVIEGHAASVPMLRHRHWVGAQHPERFLYLCTRAHTHAHSATTGPVSGTQRQCAPRTCSVATWLVSARDKRWLRLFSTCRIWSQMLLTWLSNLCDASLRSSWAWEGGKRAGRLTDKAAAAAAAAAAAVTTAEEECTQRHADGHAYSDTRTLHTHLSSMSSHASLRWMAARAPFDAHTEPLDAYMEHNNAQMLIHVRAGPTRLSSWSSRASLSLMAARASLMLLVLVSSSCARNVFCFVAACVCEHRGSAG